MIQIKVCESCKATLRLKDSPEGFGVTKLTCLICGHPLILGGSGWKIDAVLAAPEKWIPEKEKKFALLPALALFILAVLFLKQAGKYAAKL